MTIRTQPQPYFIVSTEAERSTSWPNESLVYCEDTDKWYVLKSGAWMHLGGAATDVYVNGTKYSNCKRVAFSKAVSGGTVVVYLTDDGTVNGNALFTNNVFPQFLNPWVNDAVNSYQFGGYTLSSDKKTLTLTVNKIGLSIGVLVFTSAANGVTVNLSIVGN